MTIMLSIACWKDAAQTISYVVGVVVAVFAVWNYYENSQRERAKWAVQLYEKFFEADRYTKMREAFDCDANSGEVQSIVQEESTKFTDYLNFFELVCFLFRTKQLRRTDVLTLFHYYLGCLSRHERVRTYIGTHDFEQLDRFLKEENLQVKA